MDPFSCFAIAFSCADAAGKELAMPKIAALFIKSRRLMKSQSVWKSSSFLKLFCPSDEDWGVAVAGIRRRFPILSLLAELFKD